MRLFYLVAVIGTRLVTVACLLVLSHLMPPKGFGVFTLVMTNGLALQMLFGSWLSSLATRLLVTAARNADGGILPGISAATALIVAIYAIGAIAILLIQGRPTEHVVETAGLAASLLVYEVTLAILNAAGLERRYAMFALTRNIGALACSVALVWAGFDAVGALSGQIAGTMLAIGATPLVLSIWWKSRPDLQALAIFRGQIRPALAGSITLGLYIILNAPIRNIVRLKMGWGVAGLWSLSADLFYGPLNLLASAYILSKLRLMYIDEQAGNRTALAIHSRELMNFAFGLAVPYAVGGILFAPSIAGMVLPAVQRSQGSLLASYSAVQGALTLVLYCLATLALVQKRLSLLLIIGGSTAVFPAAVLWKWGDTVQSGALAALLALASCVAGAAGLSMVTGDYRPDWRELGKLILASAGLWLASTAVKAFAAFPGSDFLAALLGVGLFYCIAVWLRFETLFELVPHQLLPMRSAGREPIAP